MVAQYQAVTAGATGTVTFRAWRGTVNYTTYPFDDDACDEINIFTEQTGSDVTTPVNTSIVPSSTAWTALSRDLNTIGSEGIRVKIEIVNNSGVAIRVDNVALEER